VAWQLPCSWEVTKKRIMVVDDDAITLETLSRVLGAEGLEVIRCDNGLTAVGEALRVSPDLVILDLMMPSPDPERCPVFDGSSALGWIKRSAKLRDLPVIILSAKPASENKGKLLQAGAAAYLQKPCDRKVLLSAIEIALAEPVKTTVAEPAEETEATSPAVKEQEWWASETQTHVLTRAELRQVGR